jgi:hypothetical protein
MIEIRTFGGKLNLDDSTYRVPQGDFVDALNITRDAEGQGQDEVLSNINGNAVVSDTLPSGINKVIGNYADRLRNRLYFFTWNDGGFNRISYYDRNTGNITVLVEDLTDTNNVGVLNFDPSYRINHIDIVYRENEQGDLLFWTDGLNPPSKINVRTAETGGYGVIQRSYIDVAKEPPSGPPICVYKDNANVTVNNLTGKLFKFKYRFVYDDLEKSVTSAQSELALPKNYALQSVETDPTINSSVLIVFNSGQKNVKKIEILGSELIATTWSDYFLIKVIDKVELSISDNATIQFNFLNNQSYIPISIQESIQPFDNVPQIAYTQSLPNGNVLDYGAITEGYDLVAGIYSTSILNNNRLAGTSNQQALVLVTTPDLIAFEGSLKIIVAGTPTIGDEYTIYYIDNNVTVSTTIIATGATQNSLRLDISNYFTGLGYIVSLDPDGNLLVVAPTPVLFPYLPTFYLSEYFAENRSSILAYDWFSKYSYGVVYFDEKGRTNGVVSTLPSTFQTQQYDETFPPLDKDVYIPEQRLQIDNRPPIWANYFEIVRTKNLSKSNFLYWVSDSTYKDFIDNEFGYKYAYISITNLLQYKSSNPSIKSIGYEFLPGDRVRFVKLYSSSGSTTNIYGTSNEKDFQILEVVTNPAINATIVDGLFLKIYLPITSGSFDFGNPAFSNYLIQIYTPQNSFNEENTIYYEFGEKYNVGNANTNQAFHYGKNQNQTDDLLTPALFDLYKGDSYFRYRNYPIGGKSTWIHNPVSGITSNFTSFYLLASLTFNTSNNPSYTAQDVTSTVAFTNTAYPIIINTPLTPPSFRVKGTIKLRPSANFSNIQLISNEWNGVSGGGAVQILGATIFANTDELVANQEKTIVIDCIFTPSLNMAYVGWGLNNYKGDLLELNIEIVDSRIITQGIIDPNFSDNFESSASPNGRAWKYDPNASQQFNPTLIRFGGEYQDGTSVNNINRFYEENFDVYDRSRGSIKKMFIEGRNQYIFHEFDVGVVTVLTQIVKDTAGNPLSAQSDTLLNKIVYPYIGQYGIGNVPESFAYGKSAKYFVDDNKGVVCRLSADGITPISVVYKMNAFFVPNLKGYRIALSQAAPDTGYPTVYGGFDAYTNKYIISMDAIYDGNDLIQNPFTTIFLDSRESNRGFETFASYHPENIGCLNNTYITFKDGNLWTHDTGPYCNFYGVQYGAYVDVAFNDRAIDRKTYLTIFQTSNDVWYCPSITSQLNTYGSTKQQSQIVAARFVELEGQYTSAILRDINSPGGLINGQTMHGNYLVVRFQKDSASNFYFLNTVSLTYVNSPLNQR